jgi:hypoxanthine phosphoribosyltransferase
MFMEYPVYRYYENNLIELNNLATIIKNHAKVDKAIDILITGSSGAFIAGHIIPAIFEVNRNIITHYIKKAKEDRHADHPYCPNLDRTVYIIDDLISSGRTIERILYHIPLQLLLKTKIFIVADPGFDAYEYGELQIPVYST